MKSSCCCCFQISCYNSNLVYCLNSMEHSMMMIVNYMRNILIGNCMMESLKIHYCIEH